jgi:hypothetical protein
MKGPEVETIYRCTNCEYLKATYDVCQGDSGFDLYCLNENKYIGYSNWRTPVWCPFRKEND